MGACEEGHTEIVKALLAHPEIDVNVQDQDGETPLHRACWMGQSEIVKILLAHPKIEPCIQNKHGETPLDHAEDWYYTCGKRKTKTLMKKFVKRKETEKQLTQEFCLAMIQPVVSSTMSRKRRAKKLRRDELRLGPDLIKSIAKYLEWKDISNKSCFEVMN